MTSYNGNGHATYKCRCCGELGKLSEAELEAHRTSPLHKKRYRQMLRAEIRTFKQEIDIRRRILETGRYEQ